MLAPKIIGGRRFFKVGGLYACDPPNKEFMFMFPVKEGKILSLDKSEFHLLNKGETFLLLSRPRHKVDRYSQHYVVKILKDQKIFWLRFSYETSPKKFIRRVKS